jgi:glycosyltransferase involved in cell wall biosynthesis
VSSTTWHVVLPAGIDDPARPSGGNVYDRRLLDGLARRGQRAEEHAVAGSWPVPDSDDLTRLAGVLAAIPDDSVVLVDGLVASGASAVIPREAGRLRLVVLLHMPVGPDRGEEIVLTAATAVLTTSAWARSQLRTWYGLRHVDVAVPGVDPVEHVTRHRDAGGTSFLCVAAIHRGKGHDVLLEALGALGDRAWTLTCVGSLDVDPAFVSSLQTQVYARTWERRVLFTGPLSAAALGASYDAADLLVLPSRSESYGMVVAEALAHGLPVVASAVGGVSEAMGGREPVGAMPGLLVPPGDAPALMGALRSWLDDPGLRERLGQAAERRRPAVRSWEATVSDVAEVLARAGAHAASASHSGVHR